MFPTPQCFDSLFWNYVYTKEKFPRGYYNHTCRDEWKLKGPRRALETEAQGICKTFLILFSTCVERGLFVITWDRKEVIHWRDVIHGLCQHSDLLLPLVFEDIHVVLSNFALWSGCQCESSIDDLFVRNNPETCWLCYSRKIQEDQRSYWNPGPYSFSREVGSQCSEDNQKHQR